MKRAAAVLGAAIAAGAVHHGDPRAALAGLVAGVVAVLAVSLSRDVTGVVIGGFFVGAGILSWTYTAQPLVVWAVLLLEGFVFAWWSRPWVTWLRPLARLGTAWLGLAYWLCGIAGALLVGHLGVAAERVAYLGVFGLAVSGVLARSSNSRDRSAGVVAAFGFALAALLFAGAGNLFRATHTVPDNDWGTGFEHRFWGGPGLLYHPNSMAGIAVLLAIRIGPDRAFAPWQRLSVVALAGFVVTVTNSRTGFVFLVAATVAYWVIGVTRGSGKIEALTPLIVILAVLFATHGTAFLGQARYADGGVTSGRVDTWEQVGRDWERAGWAEKLLGDASDARATVHRDSSGDGIELTVDNAAVGALRRGGVVGELAFLVGIVLLVRRGLRGPAWFTVAVFASLPTVATTEWLLGTTGGTLWILLVAGEAIGSGSPVPSPRCSPAGTPR